MSEPIRNRSIETDELDDCIARFLAEQPREVRAAFYGHLTSLASSQMLVSLPVASLELRDVM